MFSMYHCIHSSCNDRRLKDLDEVIDHLQSVHRLEFIRRPSVLGMSDTHGNCWYCWKCIGKLSKDHRSFKSDRAMWDHLNACHDTYLDDIMRDI